MFKRDVESTEAAICSSVWKLGEKPGVVWVDHMIVSTIMSGHRLDEWGDLLKGQSMCQCKMWMQEERWRLNATSGAFGNGGSWKQLKPEREMLKEEECEHH